MYKICMLSSAHLSYNSRIFYNKERKTLVKADYNMHLLLIIKEQKLLKKFIQFQFLERENKLDRFFVTYFSILKKAFEISAASYNQNLMKIINSISKRKDVIISVSVFATASIYLSNSALLTWLFTHSLIIAIFFTYLLSRRCRYEQI